MPEIFKQVHFTDGTFLVHVLLSYTKGACGPVQVMCVMTIRLESHRESFTAAVHYTKHTSSVTGQSDFMTGFKHTGMLSENCETSAKEILMR